jgi:hypothetical protein
VSDWQDIQIAESSSGKPVQLELYLNKLDVSKVPTQTLIPDLAASTSAASPTAAPTPLSWTGLACQYLPVICSLGSYIQWPG